MTDNDMERKSYRIPRSLIKRIQKYQKRSGYAGTESEVVRHALKVGIGVLEDTL